MEEHRTPPIKFLEIDGIDLGNLENGDSNADHKESHDEREDLSRAGGKTFEEDLRKELISQKVKLAGLGQNIR